MFNRYFDISMTDVNSENVCKPSAIFRILQEVADRQMFEERPSYHELFEQGRAFVLSRMTLVCREPLRQYDHIRAEVWPSAPMGVTFPRSYRLYRGDVVVAEATSHWALVDVNDRHIMKSSEVDLSNYTYGEPILRGELRFKIPRQPFETVGEHRVVYRDIDINRHMNNTAYPDMLMNFVPDMFNGFVSKLCIHYEAEVPLGARIRVTRSEAPPVGGEQTYYFRTFAGESENIEAMITMCRQKTQK